MFHIKVHVTKAEVEVSSVTFPACISSCVCVSGVCVRDKHVGLSRASTDSHRPPVSRSHFTDTNSRTLPVTEPAVLKGPVYYLMI